MSIYNKQSDNESDLIRSEGMGFDPDGKSILPAYEELIKENMDFDALLASYPLDKELVQGIYELILETVLCQNDRILIASSWYPAELVKSKFMKLKYAHIEYVMECFRKNTTKVEFQPSSYDRGSYLNVGISFLWETSERLNETLAFNIGYRVNKVGYASYRGNDAAYEKKMEDFAEAAMEKVREYSMLFMVIIILVRPISSYSEISVFESSVALLAGVFMADNYYMEYMNDRISTYYLFPFKKKCTSLLKRIVISQVYLIALIAVFYWGFVLMYHPTNYSGVSIAVLYIQCVCACAASMFFMGILCFTATNLLRNIGIGIGCVFLLWLFLTSSITRILPQLLQLFKLSGEVVQDGFLTPYWPSRILYAVVAIGLLFLNLYLVNKQPDYNKKGWCKHGNKGK